MTNDERKGSLPCRLKPATDDGQRGLGCLCVHRLRYLLSRLKNLEKRDGIRQFLEVKKMVDAGVL